MQISITDHSVLTHIAFAFSAFLGENVTFESFLKCDLTGTGNFEALLGTAVGLNLWHYITYYRYSLLAPRNDGNFLSLVGNVRKENCSFRAAKVRGNIEKQAILMEINDLIHPSHCLLLPFYWTLQPLG